MRSLIGFLQKIESGLLALILFLLIVLAAWQVVARNFFDGGLLWGDGFVRVAVLWVTLIGAMVASRKDCLLYTSPSPRDATLSRMPSSA